MIAELIEGGFIGQAIIGALIWGGIIVLLVTHNPVDDRLYDAGYVVLGYFFHVAQTAVISRNVGEAKLASDQFFKALADQHAHDTQEDNHL